MKIWFLRINILLLMWSTHIAMKWKRQYFSCQQFSRDIKSWTVGRNHSFALWFSRLLVIFLNIPLIISRESYNSRLLDLPYSKSWSAFYLCGCPKRILAHLVILTHFGFRLVHPTTSSFWILNVYNLCFQWVAYLQTIKCGRYF